MPLEDHLTTGDGGHFSRRTLTQQVLAAFPPGTLRLGKPYYNEVEPGMGLMVMPLTYEPWNDLVARAYQAAFVRL